jgi:hypothetical protein
MNETRFSEKGYCGRRSMDPNFLGVSAFQSGRRTLATRGEAADRRAFAAGTERCRKWRYQPDAKDYGDARLAGPQQFEVCSTGAGRVWTTCADEAGESPRLQPVRNHVVPIGLRLGQDRRPAWMLLAARLCRTGRKAGQKTNRGSPGTLAPGAGKIINGGLVTERCHRKPFPCGTTYNSRPEKTADVGPLRNEVAFFEWVQRSATSHLYRFTICQRLNSMQAACRPKPSRSTACGWRCL